jgi:hypothetical protein
MSRRPCGVAGWAELYIRALDLADQFEAAGHQRLAAELRDIAELVEERLLELAPPLDL